LFRRRATDKEGGKGKRTRKTAAVLAPIDEEETLIDLSKLPTKGVSNRLRVSDIRQVTIIQLYFKKLSFRLPSMSTISLRKISLSRTFVIFRTWCKYLFIVTFHSFCFSQMEDLDQGLENLREIVNGSRAASIHEDLQSLYAELVNEMGFTMTELEPERPNIDVSLAIHKFKINFMF
jgi:hypothetical protein